MIWATRSFRTTLFCLLLLCVLAPSVQAGSRYEGRVVGVSDGDTITVLVSGRTQVKVRLAEIDAPEKAQAFGERSKQSLANMVFNKTVRVEQLDVDRYGRDVGRVFVGNIDVNAEQIRLGMAWVYRQYARDASLLVLEQEARDARRGLWADPHALPPWEYRHIRREQFKEVEIPPEPAREARDDSPAWQCGAKRYCSQMTSCAEARYYLTQCGVRSLDGDGDGVPCEAICR